MKPNSEASHDNIINLISLISEIYKNFLNLKFAYRKIKLRDKWKNKFYFGTLTIDSSSIDVHKDKTIPIAIIKTLHKAYPILFQLIEHDATVEITLDDLFNVTVHLIITATLDQQIADTITPDESANFEEVISLVKYKIIEPQTVQIEGIESQDLREAVEKLIWEIRSSHRVLKQSDEGYITIKREPFMEITFHGSASIAKKCSIRQSFNILQKGYMFP